ncbi:MAG: Bax inhibitor-1 family protein [Vicinamibacteria bacterium]
MSLMDDAEVGYPETSMDLDARARFVSRVYTHVFAAIVAFTALEIVLFTSGLAQVIARVMLGGSWLIVLGAFTLVGWLASRVAHQAVSLPAQYAALAGFVGAEAIVFVPLLYVAQYYAPGVIQSAAAVTIMGFAGLTAIAFVTRKDFSFLGGMLRWAGVLALVLIASSLLFGFELGTFFSVAMVGLAGASILYDTSNVLHHYPEDRYVGASLELFSSVALMFWYVLRLFMGRR